MDGFGQERTYNKSNTNTMNYFVYILLCSDGSFYTGLTTDLAERITGHEMGVEPSYYTYSRRPLKLVWAREFHSHDEAFSFERQI